MLVPSVFSGGVLDFGDIDMKVKNALPFDILNKVDLRNYVVFDVDEDWIPVILNLNPHIPVFKDKDGKYYITVEVDNEDVIKVVEVMVNGFI